MRYVQASLTPYVRDVHDAVEALAPSASAQCEARVLGTVEALYEAVTGVRYRSVATRAVQALEGVCRMLHAQQELVRAVGPTQVCHTDALRKQVSKIQALFSESKALLGRDVREAEEPAAPPLPSTDSTQVAALRQTISEYRRQLDDALSQIGDLRAVNAQLRTVADSAPIAAPHVGVTFSSRYQRVEHTYDALYRGQGMEMLWHTVMCIFAMEYDTGSATNVDEAAFGRFRAAYAKALEPMLRDGAEHAFRSRAQLVSSLAGDYIGECATHGVKPNTGVVRQLTALAGLGEDTATLSLAGNYVGDGGMRCLVPLLARLGRLRVVDVRDNGLKNASVVAVAEALHAHPTPCRIELADNPFSRPGGKALLSLVNANKCIVGVGLQGTHVEGTLRERIEAQAEDNRKRIPA